MILCLLFFCLLGESMALDNATGATGNSISSKSIMCYYKGNMMDSSTELVSLDPKEIPCECEVIIYSRFSINKLSVIDVDKTFLKSVTDLNKPVIVAVSREAFYTDWGLILGPDGNAKDVKVLCDFAKETKIAGFLLENLAPECEEVALFIKESKICLTKIVYDIEMFPQDSTANTYTSYSQVCKGDFNCSTWCIQTTNNFYDKGKFAFEQDGGIVVKLVDLDDIKNECGCSSTFIGFKNIIAGFRGGSPITCAKYDVQSTEYLIK